LEIVGSQSTAAVHFSPFGFRLFRLPAFFRPGLTDDSGTATRSPALHRPDDSAEGNNLIERTTCGQKKTATPKGGGLFFNGHWLTPAGH
jgi:hypothetical protein